MVSRCETIHLADQPLSQSTNSQQQPLGSIHVHLHDILGNAAQMASRCQAGVPLSCLHALFNYICQSLQVGWRLRMLQCQLRISLAHSACVVLAPEVVKGQQCGRLVCGRLRARRGVCCWLPRGCGHCCAFLRGFCFGSPSCSLPLGRGSLPAFLGSFCFDSGRCKNLRGRPCLSFLRVLCRCFPVRLLFLDYRRLNRFPLGGVIPFDLQCL